jgi:hypothetical protein
VDVTDTAGDTTLDVEVVEDVINAPEYGMPADVGPAPPYGIPPDADY